MFLEDENVPLVLGGLRLPPPGIEPGSHASQASTLPKELSRQLIPVLHIRDGYPGSRILIFTHPGSRIQKQEQKRGVKKICCHNFLCSHKFHKLQDFLAFQPLLVPFILRRPLKRRFRQLLSHLEREKYDYILPYSCTGHLTRVFKKNIFLRSLSGFSGNKLT